ncbi:MAG: glycosyltransferase family 4 protein [Planctomycetota bacterium]
MNRRPRILFVSINDFWGGSEILWSQTACEAAAQGHEVCVAAPHTNSALSAEHIPLRKELVDRRRIGGRVSRLNDRWMRASGFSLPICSLGLRQLQPQVVCLSIGRTYEFLWRATVAKELTRSGLPYVLVVQYVDDTHAALTWKERCEAAAFYRGASKIVFVADRNRRAVERQLACTLEQAVVLQNPVQLSDLSDVAWPQADTPALGVVARLHTPTKGHDLLFEALSEPAWQARQWKLNLYGSGPDEPYLRALAQTLGIAGRVAFHGHVRDVRQVWKENHMFVLPSRGEGTPLALLEAMICARPALVTDVGGNAEWVEEGVAGFVAEAPSKACLLGTMERAWACREQWPLLGLRAREVVTRRRDPSPARTLLKLITECARGGRECAAGGNGHAVG